MVNRFTCLNSLRVTQIQSTRERVNLQTVETFTNVQECNARKARLKNLSPANKNILIPTTLTI